MITIALAEDHHVVRQGFRLLLQAEPDFRLVGEAADGLEAVRLVETKKPDVLVLDLMIPRLHGLEVVLADGSIVTRLGGLEKDNTGYDLGSLVCGSEGTLGVVTAARVRLLPVPQHTVVALLGLRSLAEKASAPPVPQPGEPAAPPAPTVTG